MYAQRRWTPPRQHKSLTAGGSQRGMKGRGGVNTRRVQMTRGSDETPAATLPQGQSIFGSGGAPSRNTQSIELEYSKDTRHQPLSSSWVSERTGSAAAGTRGVSRWE